MAISTSESYRQLYERIEKAIPTLRAQATYVKEALKELSKSGKEMPRIGWDKGLDALRSLAEQAGV